MAYNFLQRSNTYLREVDERMRLRHDILIKHLKDDLSVSKGAYSAAQEELLKTLEVRQDEDKDFSFPYATTISALQDDVRMIRTVFKFLNCNDKSTRRAMRKKSKKDQAYFLLKCFQKDNLEKWEKIFPKKSGLKTQGNPDNEAGHPEADISCHQADEIVEFLIAQIKEEKQKNLSHINELKEGCQEARKLLDEGEEPLGIMIMFIAVLVRQFPEIFADLDGLSEQLRAILQLTIALENMGFPLIGKGDHVSRKVVYGPLFLATLLGFVKKEQRAIKKGVIQWSKNQFYPSLNSEKMIQKIPGAPKRWTIYSSRASDELRFYWADRKNDLYMFYIGRKGDRTIYKSEA